jgi:hypothetical protein
MAMETLEEWVFQGIRNHEQCKAGDSQQNAALQEQLPIAR